MLGPDLGGATKEIERLFPGRACALTSSGFSALLGALESLSLRRQPVIVPMASTCFAIVNAVIASGNKPVFADVDPADGNLSFDAVRLARKQSGARWVISPNHFGAPGATSRFQTELGLRVIEDAAQSFLTTQATGTSADILVLSFYPTKTVNGIDGGCVLSSNGSLIQRVRQWTYYDSQTRIDAAPRFNCRLPNIHAAVLSVNLKRLRVLRERHMGLRHRFDSAFARPDRVLGGQATGAILSRYVLRFDTPNRCRRFQELFASRKIECGPPLLWTAPASERRGTTAARLVGCTALIPFHEELNRRETVLIEQTLRTASL